jgi:hypothetical protein
VKQKASFAVCTPAEAHHQMHRAVADSYPGRLTRPNIIIIIIIIIKQGIGTQSTTPSRVDFSPAHRRVMQLTPGPRPNRPINLQQSPHFDHSCRLKAEVCKEMRGLAAQLLPVKPSIKRLQLLWPSGVCLSAPAAA